MTTVQATEAAPAERAASPTLDTPKLKRKAAIGSVWLVGSRSLSKIIDMATLLILTRLLTPSDFGLVALSMTPVFIVEAIMELPVNQALVRLNGVTTSQLDTAFTISVLRGVAITAVLCVLAVPLSLLFKDVRLARLICVLSLAPAARGLVSPRMSEYIRAMAYHWDFISTVIPKFLSLLVAGGLGYITHSYWSIAAGTVCTPVAMIAVSYIIAPYRPRFSLAHFTYFRDFVGWVTAAAAVNAVNWQSDKLVLGRLVQRAVLGQFSLAADIAVIPDQILFKTTLGAYFAAFSHARQDPAQLRGLYLYFLKSIVLVGVPILVGLSALAKPAIVAAFGHRWMAVTPFLKILTISLSLPLLTAPLGPLAMATGHNRMFLHRSLLELAVKVPIVIVATLYWGAIGTAWSRAVSELVMAMVSMQLAESITGVPILEQVGACAVYFLGAAVMYAVLAASGAGEISTLDLGATLRLVGWGLVAAAAYAATVYAGWIALRKPDGPEEVAHRLLQRALAPRPSQA